MPTPTITNISPTTGQVGAAVVVTGTNLGGVTTVKFNGRTSAFSITDASHISATVPNGATTGIVTVNTPYTQLALSKPSLVGLWPLGVPVGGLALDTGLWGLNGTGIGGITIGGAASIIPSEPSTATAFDGVNDAIRVNHNALLGLTGDLTFIATIKPTDFLVTGRHLFNKYQSGGLAVSPFSWSMLSSGRMQLWRGDGNTQTAYIATTASLTAGAANIIAVTVSGNTLTHYLNGVADTPITIAQSTADSSLANVHIGGHPDYPTSSTFGSVQGLAAFSTALTSAEIAEFGTITGYTGPTFTVSVPTIASRFVPVAVSHYTDWTQQL